MGIFATDRDLAAIEPGLPRRAMWLGQRLASGQCSIAVTTLTASSASAAFDDAGIGEGNVVLVGGRVLEVIDRQDATRLTVSAMRAGGGAAEEPIPPEPEPAGAFEIPTWAPQIGLVERQVLRMLGLAGDPQGPEKILDPAGLRELVCFGALHLVHAELERAGTPGAGGEAERYRALWMRGREAARVAVDLDGDGEPDEVRRLVIGAITRA